MMDEERDDELDLDQEEDDLAIPNEDGELEEEEDEEDLDSHGFHDDSTEEDESF